MYQINEVLHLGYFYLQTYGAGRTNKRSSLLWRLRYEKWIHSNPQGWDWSHNAIIYIALSRYIAADAIDPYICTKHMYEVGRMLVLHTVA